jgi:hypothetical protein
MGKRVDQKNRFQKWLDKSPIVTIIVTSAAIIGFFLGVVNSGITIHEKIKNRDKISLLFKYVTMSYEQEVLNPVEFLSLYLPISVAQDSNFYGGFTDMLVYFNKPRLIITNLSNNQKTLFAFSMDLDFGDNIHYNSQSYVIHESEGDNSFSPFNYLILKPKELKEVNIMFYFHKNDFLEKYYQDSRPNQITVSCRDESGRFFQISHN